jgi:hypothetical protein
MRLSHNHHAESPLIAMNESSYHAINVLLYNERIDWKTWLASHQHNGDSHSDSASSVEEKLMRKRVNLVGTRFVDFQRPDTCVECQDEFGQIHEVVARGLWADSKNLEEMSRKWSGIHHWSANFECGLVVVATLSSRCTVYEMAILTLYDRSLVGRTDNATDRGSVVTRFDSWTGLFSPFSASGARSALFSLLILLINR